MLAVGNHKTLHNLFPDITSPLIICTIFYLLYATSVFNHDRAYTGLILSVTCFSEKQVSIPFIIGT
jgi:hypothetical protein